MNNAIQFIKDHGVDKAREVVSGAPDRATTVKPSLDFKHFMYGICENATGAYINLFDLKRIVESVDLIESYGGVGLLEYQVRCLGQELSDSLRQAIADYESIYGGEHV